MSERITQLVRVVDILDAVTRVNSSADTTPLQPYEITHLVKAVTEERRAIDRALRHMPYLGGMQRTPSLAADVERAVDVIKAVALRNGEIEAKYDELRSDVAAMKRILGTS